jgi:tetratricopeptide (TPR) repeat protein
MSTARQRSVDPQRPFVGRDAELETLQSRLAQGRLILLAGDPGIGKTRMVEEFAADAAEAGALVCWGRCWEGDGAPAFWPWIEIVRELVRRAAPETLRAQLGAAAADIAHLVPDLRACMPDLPDPARLDPKQARFRLFDGVTTFLRAVATAQPLVLVLEDLHWADAPSLLLLQFLAREIAAAPLLVIGTFRDVDVGGSHPLTDALGELSRHRHCEHLSLGGLGAADVRRYVALVLGEDAARAVAASLHRETDGNPFFLGEMVRLLAREPGADGRRWAVPETVRDVILRRLRTYSAECNHVLRIAAVIGRAFTLAVLQRVPDLGHYTLLDLLSEAIAGRLLTETPGVAGGYRFTHSLIRETLYDDLTLAARVQLHRRVGEALEACYGASGEARAAELAHHFLQAAADGDPERAIDYAARAGAHATDLLAHEEAIAHYQRALHALELWRPADELRACDLLLALGEARVRTGDPAAAEETFLRAAALARRLGAAPCLARAALGMGEVERFKDGLIGLLEEAVDRLGPEDSVLRARTLSRLSVALYWSQPEVRKLALSREAVAMARRLGHTPTLAYALSSRIAALSGPDDVEERLAAATEMASLAERCGERELALIGLGWSIADSLALGDVHRVRRDLETFAAAAAELHHPYYAWWATALRAMQAILQGRLVEAESLAHEAFGLGQRAVVSDATQVFAGQLYVLRIEQERHAEVEAIARGFVDQFPLVPGGHCALALLYADQGRSAEAEAEIAALAADDFAALPRNPEWLGSVACLAQATALIPRAPHADTLYELLAPYHHRIIVSGMGVLCSGAVAHFLGMLAARRERWDDAAAHFEEALRLHALIDAVPWTAYTEYEYAALALARRRPGDHERADALRARALHTAEELGMRRLRGKLLALATPPGAGEDAGGIAVESGNGTARRVGLLRKEGDYWTLEWEGAPFRLKHSIGLHYLAVLVRQPGREVLATDLVTTYRRRRSSGPAPGDGGAADARTWADGDAAPARRTLADAGPLLDARAERAYRGRLADLRATLTEAERCNDLGQIDCTRAEIEAIGAELARAVGLGGRRRRASSHLERARVSATRAIQAAVRRIRENDGALGRHLATAVKTGTFCSYSPDPRTPVSWRL